MFGKKEEINEMNKIGKLYSIRDSKSELFCPPFLARTHGEAERNFAKVANDPKSQIFATPEDFDLYHLGTYDDASGSIEALKTPEHVIKAIHCLQPNVAQMRDQILRESIQNLNPRPNQVQ